MGDAPVRLNCLFRLEEMKSEIEKSVDFRNCDCRNFSDILKENGTKLASNRIRFAHIGHTSLSRLSQPITLR